MNTISKELEASNETKLTLKNEFSLFFEQAEEWRVKAEGLVINDISQKEEMKQAREARIALKNIRTNTENKRKELKEESLRTGKAIDGMANIIKFLIVPIEEDLRAKEDFEKIYNEKLAAELLEKRSSELGGYDVETSFYKLGEMPQESYNQLLDNSKLAFNARIESQRKIEEDRLNKEKEYRLEQERIKKENEDRIEAQRIENVKLKEEAEKRAKVEAKRVAKEIAAAKERQLKEKADKEAQEAILRKEADKREKIEKERKAKEQQEKENQDAILRKEREAREKVEAQLKAKKDAEIKAIKDADVKAKAEKAAQEKSEKEALLSPDKIKLENLANEIVKITLPEVKSTEAKEVLKKVQILLNKTSNYIKEESIKL